MLLPLVRIKHYLLTVTSLKETDSSFLDFFDQRRIKFHPIKCSVQTISHKTPYKKNIDQTIVKWTQIFLA